MKPSEMKPTVKDLMEVLMIILLISFAFATMVSFVEWNVENFWFAFRCSVGFTSMVVFLATIGSSIKE